MPVSPGQVRNIAGLARLELTDAEVEALTGELNALLEHCEELAELDSEEEAFPDGDPGEPDGLQANAPYRDPGTPPDGLSLPLSEMAPDFREGFFVVPRLPAVDGGEHGGSA